MKVAVDARPLQHPHTGIGRYTHEILSRLVGTGHDWFLYGAPPQMERWSDRVHIRTCSASGLSSQLFAQYIFPRWMKSDRIEVFWSPRHHLPPTPPGVKSLVTIHDFAWHFWPETMPLTRRILERLLMPRAIAHADRIIAISQSTAADLIRLFEELPPVDVIPLATCFDIADASNLDSLRTPYFLFVGTQEPRKNLRRLIVAWSKVAKSLPSHSLLLVGSKGWGRQHMEVWIRECGVESSVDVVGELSDCELGIAYANAEALVMPSLYEGFGLPLLEAMQQGTPVITTSYGATAEVAGDAGLLVDPMDIDSIAAAIQRIGGDKELRADLSRKASRRAALFTWERAALDTLACIDKLC